MGKHCPTIWKHTQLYPDAPWDGNIYLHVPVNVVMPNKGVRACHEFLLHCRNAWKFCHCHIGEAIRPASSVDPCSEDSTPNPPISDTGTFPDWISFALPPHVHDNLIWAPFRVNCVDSRQGLRFVPVERFCFQKFDPDTVLSVVVFF